mmetsp:Transcript_42893/g.74250  ORF Transcript_42893/g.74250 Transcript_42893/m.74250 type:complete len:165 (+) Transcript_42893:315-809(+)
MCRNLLGQRSGFSSLRWGGWLQLPALSNCPLAILPAVGRHRRGARTAAGLRGGLLAEWEGRASTLPGWRTSRRHSSCDDDSLDAAHPAGTAGIVCLMHLENLEAEEAIQRAKAARPVIDPHGDFRSLLAKGQEARKVGALRNAIEVAREKGFAKSAADLFRVGC